MGSVVIKGGNLVVDDSGSLLVSPDGQDIDDCECCAAGCGDCIFSPDAEITGYSFEFTDITCEDPDASYDCCCCDTNAENCIDGVCEDGDSCPPNNGCAATDGTDATSVQNGPSVRTGPNTWEIPVEDTHCDGTTETRVTEIVYCGNNKWSFANGAGADGNCLESPCCDPATGWPCLSGGCSGSVSGTYTYTDQGNDCFENECPDVHADISFNVSGGSST